MKKFLKAFVYAGEGVIDGIMKGRNIRLHVLSAIIVLIAGWLTGLSQIEWMLIIVIIAVMIALELMNTAVEYVVDLVTIEFHPLAKKAKDTAAGSVLVFAIASVIVGCMIFFPKWFG